jgi:3-hydroxyisobutyrate dehydrogenase-like beta-hydroxyacid dehydrogenase
MPEERIGYIGVGAMGKPIATRFLQAGYRLSFNSSRKSTVAELESAGATALPTPLLVADQADVLITCLPADSELFQVYLGPDGVIEHLQPDFPTLRSSANRTSREGPRGALLLRGTERPMEG